MEKEFEIRRKKIEDILNEALPLSPGKGWSDLCFGKLPECVNRQHLDGLINPCQALMSQGGKRWRPLLLVLCTELALQGNNKLTEEQKSDALENAYRITPLLEFVHTASLIHDDIEDKADMRRGKPCAHITYGNDTAINAGSWLYFLAAQSIHNLNAGDSIKKQFYDMYTQELRRLHLGQAMDIAWHRQNDYFPSIDEYKAMVRSKTGTLASLAARSGFLAGLSDTETSEKAGETAAGIGIGFQILDDVQNLTTGNPGKKRGDDIVEGKKSLPVLLHIQKKKEDKGILSDCFAKASDEGIDSPAVERAIAVMESSGSIKEAFDIGYSLIKEKTIELTSHMYYNSSVNIKGTSPAVLIQKLFEKMLPAL